VRRRWLSVVAAVVTATGLAGGTAVASDRLFLAQAAPPPELKGVSAATLSQMGIVLNSAQSPLYCRVVSAAMEHGVQPPGRTGCPVSRYAAELTLKDAFPGWSGSGLGVSALAPASWPAGTVLDAALVRASAPRQPLLGSDHLVWLFVVQGAFLGNRIRPLVACATPVAGTLPPSVCRGPLKSWAELVFVDAETSRFLTTLPVAVSGGGFTIQGSSTATPRRLPITRLPEVDGSGP
jgi:hypothetical protein